MENTPQNVSLEVKELRDIWTALDLAATRQAQQQIRINALELKLEQITRSPRDVKSEERALNYIPGID